MKFLVTMTALGALVIRPIQSFSNHRFSSTATSFQQGRFLTALQQQTVPSCDPNDKENVSTTLFSNQLVDVTKLSGPPFHYIFGYGSLLCASSRALTAPETQARTALPVDIAGVQRVWAKRSKIGMTAMGIRWQEDASTTGIILPVNENELPQFDNREKGYQRISVEIDKVQLASSCSHVKATSSDCVFLDAKRSGAKDSLKIWAYLPQLFVPANAQFPILQSYVDTILRGCLSVGGEDLAKEFIQGTKGWNPHELVEYLDEDAIRGEPGDLFWINDRDMPLYSRGDAEHSRSHAKIFDSLLEAYAPEAFKRRTR